MTFHNFLARSSPMVVLVNDGVISVVECEESSNGCSSFFEGRFLLFERRYVEFDYDATASITFIHCGTHSTDVFFK